MMGMAAMLPRWKTKGYLDTPSKGQHGKAEFAVDKLVVFFLDDFSISPEDTLPPPVLRHAPEAVAQLLYDCHGACRVGYLGIKSPEESFFNKHPAAETAVRSHSLFNDKAAVGDGHDFRTCPCPWTTPSTSRRRGHEERRTN